jgi:hypothetical protein
MQQHRFALERPFQRQFREYVRHGGEAVKPLRF